MLGQNKTSRIGVRRTYAALAISNHVRSVAAMTTLSVAMRCLFCKAIPPLTLRDPIQPRVIDLAGQTFGRLRVRHFAGVSPIPYKSLAYHTRF